MTPSDMRQLRHRLGLTQDALAAALGLGRTTIADYESDGTRRRARPIPRVVALALAALELSLPVLSRAERR